MNIRNLSAHYVFRINFSKKGLFLSTMEFVDFMKLITFPVLCQEYCLKLGSKTSVYVIFSAVLNLIIHRLVYITALQ